MVVSIRGKRGKGLSRFPSPSDLVVITFPINLNFKLFRFIKYVFL